MESIKKEPKTNPKATAGLFSHLFIWWIRKILWKNYKGELTEDDLYDTLEADKTKKLGDELEKSWTAELVRAKSSNRQPSITKAIIRTVWVQYLLHGILALVNNLLFGVAQPLLLGKVVEFFTGPAQITEKDAYIYTAAMLVLVFLKSFGYHHYTYLTNTLGMRIRIACCSLIYRKILRHSKYTMNQSETGKVMNLMTNDVARFDLALQYYHWLWLAFVQVAVVTYFLWTYVGVSALIGFSYIFLSTVPLQGYMGKVSSHLRKKAATLTDERMKLMNELVSGIQMIKMYAWEMPFAKLVSQARKKEINVITKASYIKGFLLSSLVFIERSSLFVTLLAYSLFEGTVMPHKVFAMAQFYNLLNLALALFYPMAVTYTAESSVSLERIQSFLVKEESTVPVRDTHFFTSDKKSIGRVAVANGCGSWSSDRSTLKDINLTVEPGSLCAIIGPVGSGKSSLLSVLLGELPLTSGVYTVSGEISYSSQEPWIFVGTVRQNILLGQQYDPVRYREVVRVCALREDFRLFPHGDQTLVGARGITLSGGQRARVNLARAIYRDADVYFLDDPLSAVDAHVGKKIFDNCVMQFLKDKTRILVTHQLQYLQEAHHLVIMNEGAIETQGSPKEIMASNSNFGKLLADEEKEPVKELVLQSKTSIKQGVLTTNTEVCQSSEDKEYKEIIDITTSPWNIIKEYLKSSGGLCHVIILFTILLLGQVATSSADYWVTLWSNSEVSRLKGTWSTIEHDLSRDNYLKVYGGLVLAVILITIFRSMLFFKICMRASRKLHNSMFTSVLRATMRFFDTNPIGRILNRFSKDTGLMDENLPYALLIFIQIYLVMCGILVMVAISNYYMILFMLIVGFIFWWTGAAFLSLIRFLRKLEGIKRSPIFSHVTDTLNGLTTIRSADALDIVNEEFNKCQDHHTSSWCLVLGVNAALGLWLDIISGFFIVLVTVSFHIIGREYINGASVGLAISQSLILMGMLQHGVLQLTEVVNQSVSVERILQYTNLEPEPPLESANDRKPPDSWPEEGKVEFRNVLLRYGKNDPPVLKNLNFVIQQHQKVGVVGRTGAGKSSLLAALFRLANIEGSVLIDNVDTGLIGLHDLRKRISIIPQEPVLFSATMRYNLDPFGDFVDEGLWMALEEVELKTAVKSLDWQITEGGGNLSVGQRQLVCLARAILRKSQILVLDEATANVDLETDALIQRTIRRKFANCTVLTIAHRLNTIMDSDMVLVMNAGTMVEYDHPHVLLQNKSSSLSKLVEEVSKGMAEKLRMMAKEAFQLKYGFDDAGLPNLESYKTKL